VQGASKAGRAGADDQHVRVQPLAFGAHSAILARKLTLELSQPGLDLKPSAESLELFQRNSELADDFEKEGWPDFVASVKRNRDRATIRMIPALMAAGLAGLGKA
jgi:hypothetical protein